MASLFGRNKLKEKAKLIPTSQILPHTQIIKNWQKDYHNGTLKQDKKTCAKKLFNGIRGSV
ncbi:MAG: hypothetical protein LBC07_02025 [Elusimicrobiota bacterium]|nr:hypothetical protein [Elusimicrobiota bacterium]